MPYVRITKASGASLSWWQRVAHRLMTRVLPQANPDFEEVYPRVATWWIEVDELGEPQREIGFDASGEAIVIGPLGRNTGVVVDCGGTFTEDFDDTITHAEFEATWTRVAGRLRVSDDPGE